MTLVTARRWRDRLRRLRSDRSGLAMMEFAFTLPVILAMGGYGTELSFLALSNLRVSQYALNLADNASRVGVDAGAGVTQLREVDINDVLQGTRKEGEIIDLTTNGRVILSSLERVRRTYSDGTSDANRVQRIHWQRCIGLKGRNGANRADFRSHYGTTNALDGTDTTPANKGTNRAAGMGEAGQEVNAMNDAGVMFVEINYQYTPLFGTMFVEPQVIRYTASFIVRDNRDFSQIYNPDPAVPVASKSTCDLYAA